MKYIIIFMLKIDKNKILLNNFLKEIDDNHDLINTDTDNGSKNNLVCVSLL
jgi:hypothetical protein